MEPRAWADNYTFISLASSVMTELRHRLRKQAQTPLETAHGILLRGKDPENVAQADFQAGEGEGTQQVSDSPPTPPARSPK